MEQLGITVFDVAVIAIGVFGAAIGASAGFAHAILFIGSWIGAGYIALNYSNVIQPEVAKLVNGNNELATFGSMLVVFVAATGLAARYFYLRGRRPVAFHPANVPASSAPANRAQVEE